MSIQEASTAGGGLIYFPQQLLRFFFNVFIWEIEIKKGEGEKTREWTTICWLQLKCLQHSGIWETNPGLLCVWQESNYLSCLNYVTALQGLHSHHAGVRRWCTALNPRIQETEIGALKSAVTTRRSTHHKSPLRFITSLLTTLLTALVSWDRSRLDLLLLFH